MTRKREARRDSDGEEADCTPTQSPTAIPTAEPGCCYPNPAEAKQQWLLGVCRSLNHSKAECLNIVDADGNARCLWEDFAADCLFTPISTRFPSVSPTAEPGCCYVNLSTKSNNFCSECALCRGPGLSALCGESGEDACCTPTKSPTLIPTVDPTTGPYVAEFDA